MTKPVAAQRPAAPPSPARPQVVQRFALSIHNLSDKSSINFAEGGGKGNVVGSKVPHMTHTFQVGNVAGVMAAPVAATYKPDNWVNKDDATMIAIKADITALSDFAFRQSVVAVFTNWTCAETIFESLLASLFYDAPAPTKWFDPNTQGGAHSDYASVQIKDALHARQALVIHLVTMRAAIYWREKTMTTLNVSSVTLKSDKVVALNWEAAKLEGRKMVKKRLVDRVAPPMTPPSEGGAADEFGVALFPSLKKVAGFKDIIEKKTYGSKHAYEIISSDKFVDGGKRGDLVAAYNHLRFALWTEWRGAYELYGF